MDKFTLSPPVSPMECPELGIPYACDEAWGKIGGLVQEVRGTWPNMLLWDGHLETFEPVLERVIGEVRDACSSCEKGCGWHPSIECLGPDPFEGMADAVIDIQNFHDIETAELTLSNSYLLVNGDDIARIKRCLVNFAKILTMKIERLFYGKKQVDRYESNLSFLIRELLKNAFTHGNQRNDLLALGRSVLLFWEIHPGGVVVKVGDHGTVFEPDSEVRGSYVRTTNWWNLAGERQGLNYIKNGSILHLHGFEPLKSDDDVIGKLVIAHCQMLKMP